jgi:hypothetical protein
LRSLRKEQKIVLLWEAMKTLPSETSFTHRPVVYSN